MGYCLARHDLWPMNLICEDVADYIRQEQERHRGEDSFPLHKYLHHGLSSQAMAFNLIGPLIVHNDLEPLKIAIERLGVEWPGGDVEAVFDVGVVRAGRQGRDSGFQSLQQLYVPTGEPLLQSGALIPDVVRMHVGVDAELCVGVHLSANRSGSTTQQFLSGVPLLIRVQESGR